MKRFMNRITVLKIASGAVFLIIAITFVSRVTNSDQSRENSMKQNTPADRYSRKRLEMVDTQIRKRGIKNSRVLEALRSVPRHLFVPSGEIESAYDDHPLPIGHRQTISQPYIVALMTEVLELEPGDKVLEIGTGSGYQAAVLAELVDTVFTIEIVEPLGRAAGERLRELGYTNVNVRIGDGYKGWIEEAPFDAIIATAAPETIPLPLMDQLAEGGRLVIPVGKYYQELQLVTKKDGRIEKKNIASVRFVPMIGGREDE